MANIPTSLSKEIKDQYKIKDNTFTKEVDSDVAKKLELEVGDAKQPDKFIPQVKIKKWDNEVNASFRLVDSELETPQVITDKDTIKWQGAKRDVHFYQTKQNNYQEYRNRNLGFNQPTGNLTYVKTPFPYIKVGNEIWAREDELEKKIRQQKALEASGDVLVVGLGLGIINNHLKDNPNVKSITVVEINKEVIDLLQKEHPDRLEGITLVNDDFYNFAKTTNKKFDYIYGDIFPTISVAYFNYWEKFINAAEPLLSNKGILDGRLKDFYDSHDPSSFDEDVYEFEVILKEKPATNKVEFTIQTKELDFYYQPELTPEEIAEGCYRPENIIGSYAVYHKNKKDDYSQVGGKNYQNGKAFHIYRPKIVDADGNWVWGQLNIDINTGILTVTIPQDFLDKAVYPVVVDPTFGYTSSGGSTQKSFNVFLSSLFTCPEAGTAIKITGWIIWEGPPGTCNTAIYKHSDLSLKITSSNLSYSYNTTPVETDFTISETALEATDYLLGLWGGVDGWGGLAYDSGSANQGHEGWASSGSYIWSLPLPDPLYIHAHNTNKYSIYVTYTASGGATQTKTITAKARLQKQGVVTVTAKGRIQITRSKTIDSKARIQLSTSRTVSANALIEKTFIKSIEAKGRIQLQRNKSISAKGRIQIVWEYTIESKARIQRLEIKTITVKGRVQKSATKTISASARIQRIFSHSLTAKARIGIANAKTILAKARIQSLISQTIVSKARIQISSTKTIETKGRIQHARSYTISSLGRIQKEEIKTITAKGRISKQGEATISAKSRIGITSTKTITARGRISGTAQTIEAKAKIVCISIPVLISPAQFESVITPFYLIWEIPTCCKGRNIHAHVQIDRTDNTFGDLEKELFSYKDSGFQYWNGASWQTYPTIGVTSAYYGNQARILVNLTPGTKYWRVRGGVK